MNLLPRSNSLELMDSAPLSADELLAALEFLAWANKRLGGYRVILDHFDAWSRNWPPSAQRSVLDVGTGWGDIPIALAQWAKVRGFILHVTAIDSTPAVASLARANLAGVAGVEIIESDLESFAHQGRRFDYVIGSLFLHHVSRKRQTEVLRLCDAMAMRGIVFSDLRRSTIAWLGVSLLTTLFGERITRHDGPLSVRRAFVISELRALATQAGLSYLRSKNHSFFRLSLAGCKENNDA